MLRIYDVVLEVMTALRPVMATIERRDPDLARQMRRAATSVPLNISEGSLSRGKNRPARYATAMGSMRETLSCMEVAMALGYIDQIDAALRRQIDHVLGTLHKVAR